MNPEIEPPTVVTFPQSHRHRRHTLRVLLACVLVAAPLTAAAQPAPKKGGGKTDKAPGEDTAGAKKAKVMDFTGIDISGRLRTPQLLYFLDRAAEELDRASLERRSFIPEMVRSIDEEDL